MDISDYQRTVVLLGEASRLHERARVNLIIAEEQYSQKPYSSEPIFNLGVAAEQHNKAKDYLNFIQSQTNEFKDK